MGERVRSERTSTAGPRSWLTLAGTALAGLCALPSCGEEAEASIPPAGGEALLADVGADPDYAPPPPGVVASHGGAVVSVGPHPVEVVARPSGEVEAYFVGASPPRGADAIISVRLPTDAGVRPVMLTWDPERRAHRGTLHGASLVDGPVAVRVVVGGQPYRGVAPGLGARGPAVAVLAPARPEIVASAPRPGVIVEAPPQPQVIVEAPPQPQVIVEAPPRPDVIVEAPPRPEIVVDAPRGPAVVVEAPRRPEIVVAAPPPPPRHAVVVEAPRPGVVVVERPPPPRGAVVVHGPGPPPHPRARGRGHVVVEHHPPRGRVVHVQQRRGRVVRVRRRGR
ncbi:MAG: hypothetical protein KF729_35075 [Sandaracinaceae bacterium]|nr:hypothetical protein [Sandaracinaceae bacterium]